MAAQPHHCTPQGTCPIHFTRERYYIHLRRLFQGSCALYRLGLATHCSTMLSRVGLRPQCHIMGWCLWLDANYACHCRTIWLAFNPAFLARGQYNHSSTPHQAPATTICQHCRCRGTCQICACCLQRRAWPHTRRPITRPETWRKRQQLERRELLRAQFE